MRRRAILSLHTKLSVSDPVIFTVTYFLLIEIKRLRSSAFIGKFSGLNGSDTVNHPALMEVAFFSMAKRNSEKIRHDDQNI